MREARTGWHNGVERRVATASVPRKGAMNIRANGVQATRRAYQQVTVTRFGGFPWYRFQAPIHGGSAGSTLQTPMLRSEPLTLHSDALQMR